MSEGLETCGPRFVSRCIAPSGSGFTCSFSKPGFLYGMSARDRSMVVALLCAKWGSFILHRTKGRCRRDLKSKWVYIMCNDVNRVPYAPNDANA